MRQLSLVRIKSANIVGGLASGDPIVLTSYREPIGMVVPIDYATKEDFLRDMQKVADENAELFGNGQRKA